jgi:glycosyltransferase involved in cell wall biosynthesis
VTRLAGTPLVSFGLPVHNGERFLPTCLESLLAQTYANFEIVISDNASTDGTWSIIQSLAARDCRVRPFRTSRNLGGAWNHNRVLELACGEYFRWCGADDVIAPRFVEACVAALEQTPRAVLAFPMSVVIDEAGNKIDRTRSLLPLDSPDPVRRFQSLLRALPATQNAFYGLIRTDTLRRARPMGTFMANDRCLLAELSLMGPFVQIEEHLMFRRKHEENARRSVDEEHRLLRPEAQPRFGAREWGVLRHNLATIRRASVGYPRKLKLLRSVGAWVLSQRAEFAQECKDLAVYAMRRARRRDRSRHHRENTGAEPALHG